jgi:AbrB family looped-hinge helix DNA binding protein
MYKTKVEYDSEIDEYFIIIPDELCDAMNIQAGDELVWIVEGDNIILRKKSS